MPRFRRVLLRCGLPALLVVSAAAPVTAQAQAGGPNALSAAERAAGWRSLFDGTTFAGWRGIGSTTVPAGHWAIVDGAIQKIAKKNVAVQKDGQPMAGGDLMSDATYGDFELAWEWKATPVANSGLKYNVSEELSMAVPPGHAALGFEYQMIDDDRHPDGKLIKHKTGDLYDLISSNDKKHVKPIGEWNESRVVFRGNHGEHWLNGEKVVEYELGSPSMDAALAASKYKTIAGFGDRRRGHIVLQDHNDEVAFRHIRIRDLGSTK